MNNVADELNVGKYLYWQSGSSDDITSGNITTERWKYFSGTNAALDSGSTLTMDSSTSATSYIMNQDSDATLGNVVFSNTSTRLNTTTQSVKILGDCTVTPGKNVYVSDYSMEVDGILSVPNTAGCHVTTGDLTLASAFNLEGTMTLSGGDVTINSIFDIVATGALSTC